MSKADKPKTASTTPGGDLPDTVRCTAVKANGERCRGRRHDGSDRCFFHDNPERVAAAGRRGGAATRERRARAVLPKSAAIELESAEEVRRLLADLLTRVRRGSLDTSTAYCLNAIAQTGLKVLEVAELERRLEALERQLGGDAS